MSAVADYLREIRKNLDKGDSTEHTHRPAPVPREGGRCRREGDICGRRQRDTPSPRPSPSEWRGSAGYLSPCGRGRSERKRGAGEGHSLRPRLDQPHPVLRRRARCRLELPRRRITGLREMAQGPQRPQPRLPRHSALPEDRCRTERRIQAIAEPQQSASPGNGGVLSLPETLGPPGFSDRIFGCGSGHSSAGESQPALGVSCNDFPCKQLQQ
jgi:hypothetical protein